MLKDFTLIDTSINQENIAQLQKTSEAIRGKAEENFISSEEWPYAHEYSIIKKHYAAFGALTKKTLDVPIIPCISCLKLFPESNVTHTDLFDPNIPAWDDLLDLHGEKYKFVCNYCKEKFKKKTISFNLHFKRFGSKNTSRMCDTSKRL